MKSEQRQTQQRARAGRDVTQVAAEVHLQVPSPPVRAPDVSWPVRVGDVPRLAAAFQPRTATCEALRLRAGDPGDGGGPVLSQVLSGDGGVGKSQLAAAVARALRDQEHGVTDVLDVLVWISATDPDQIITGYAEAANRLCLPGSDSGDLVAAARAFLAWLAETDRRWLVVLDDITDPPAVDPWWPDGNPRNGRVLATTRRRDALLSGQGRRLVPLDLYEPAEAAAFLRHRLSDAGCSQLYEEGAAREVCRALGLLPLALGHAAAYMINKRCDAATYLARFHAAGSRLCDLLPPEADTEGYGRPVATAPLLSLDAVQAADDTQLARSLIEFIALMDPLGHPAELWTTRPVREHLRTGGLPRRRRLGRRQPAITEQDVLRVLDCLRTYALITQDSDRAPIRMHALTARAVRETIRPEALPAIARTAGDAVLALWPELDHQDRDLSAVLRANTALLDQHTHPRLWQPATHACLYRVSSSLTATGLYEQAVEYNRALVQRTTELHGADHADTLIACNNLAISYSDAGRPQDALLLHKRVLAGYERLLGPDHPDTLSACNNLANAYSDAGRTRQALRLGERVLADRDRLLGPDHPDTLTARHNLAISYSNAGRTQEALALRERVLADYERLVGRDHPATLVARNNLANSYSGVGRTQEALVLRERVLADRERVLGPDHPDTLSARNNLANSYSEAGRAREALDLRERVLADRERVLGPDHPDTLTARENVTHAHRAVEEDPRAAPPL